MDSHWCCKCRTSTPTKDVHEAPIKGGRLALKGSCSTCGCKKCKFISQKGEKKTTSKQ
jgi:hypothetical protein